MPAQTFVQSAIDKLRGKLLDLSGRNSLISFRHSDRSRRQVRIIDLTPDTAFQMLEDGKSIEVAPLPLPSSEPEDEQTSEFASALEAAKQQDEEKLGQLQQLDGDADGTYRPEHLELARKGLLGSTLNVRGAKRVNELQRTALGSRMKLPLLFAFDVIHGYRTLFPIPLAEAASWDPEAVERAAAVAAAEAAAAGLKWTFAPMVDIARDPRWGRIAEGAGEDPHLGAALASARVRGFQGADPWARFAIAKPRKSPPRRR